MEFVNDRIVKRNGGNVASYFCTPQGRVVHAVLGPVSAEQLLQEAEWADYVYHAAARLPVERRAARIADSHRRASRAGQQRRIHELLAARPLPALEDVYAAIFQSLGERVKGEESATEFALRRDNERLRREVAKGRRD